MKNKVVKSNNLSFSARDNGKFLRSTLHLPSSCNAFSDPEDRFDHSPADRGSASDLIMPRPLNDSTDKLNIVGAAECEPCVIVE